MVAIKRLRFHVDDTSMNQVRLTTKSKTYTEAETQDLSHPQLFQREVYVWSKLKHENVLELLGYVFCKDTGFPLLISDWMENGSAWDYVTRNKYLTISDIKRLVCFSVKGCRCISFEASRSSISLMA